MRNETNESVVTYSRASSRHIAAHRGFDAPVHTYGGVHGARGWIQDLISMGLSFTGSFIIIKPNCAAHFFFLFYFILSGGIGLKNSSFFHVAQSHRNLDFMDLYVVRVHERYSQLCARSSHTCERLAWRETDCVVKQSQNIQQCHYYCTTRIDTGHRLKFFEIQ